MILTESQSDLLKQVGNIGSGQATVALSQLIGRKIMIAVTQVDILNSWDKIRPIIKLSNSLMAGVHLHVLGDLQGEMALLLEENSALKLANTLLIKHNREATSLDEMEKSVIKEVGSILSASYLNALSELLKLVTIPSTPTLVMNKGEEILASFLNTDRSNDNTLFIGIENEFVDANSRIKGYFLFIPKQSCISKIIENLD